MSDGKALIATACQLADTARAITLGHFRRRDLATENKAGQGFDPVTQADREAEEAMRAILAERRPADAVLGEELGHSPGSSGLTWVLDPIDGTRAFISGAPSWGVLIAVDSGEGPVLGVIDQPWTGERFLGGFGEAWTERCGRREGLATRRCATLGDAVLYTTYPHIGSPAELAGFNKVRDRVRLTRYGLDCYAYALLAAGHVDLVIEAGLQRYDIAAPQAVIEAAGGVVSDWRGRPAHLGGRVLAAGDPACHAQALEILSKVPEAGTD
ncbi:MAG: histidinol-phosphatase [Alphaproteobacteria bacterium]|nr:MAG: histidinol-phosphatase [Alphaproteobacteria bacterium]